MGSLRPDPSSTGCRRPWVLNTRGHSWATQADLVPVSVGDTAAAQQPGVKAAVKTRIFLRKHQCQRRQRR